MKRLTVHGDVWGDNVDREVVKVLRDGGIVMHPTETCYGLAVDIFNEDAVARLYALKEMSMRKPVSIIVHSIDDAARWGDVDEKARKLMTKFWPGPYTFIVRRGNLLPPFFNKGIEKVGLRNPSTPGILNVVKKLGHSVTTTSANLSGRPQAYDVEDFLTQLKGENLDIVPDLIVDAGFLGHNEPSAVYDVVDDVVIRGEIDLN